VRDGKCCGYNIPPHEIQIYILFDESFGHEAGKSYENKNMNGVQVDGAK
jgi:hypothetical protein